MKVKMEAMHAIYICPFFTENALSFLYRFIHIDGVRLSLVSQDPVEALPYEIRQGLAGHWRIADCLQKDELLAACKGLGKQLGKAGRIFAATEHIQIQVAWVREQLEVPGLPVETVKKFRDKGVMKEFFRAKGVPCARHCSATNEKQAWAFIEKNGFPVCVKPVDGAATLSTFRVEDAASFAEVLRGSGVSPERPLQIEEWITGQEHSFETVSIKGKPIWHSLTHYYPTPLECMRNPWIQYRVVLPREIDGPDYDGIREVGRKALESLGMETGLTHMEWFKRPDGSLAIGEVAARPPGVQIMPLINRAHDIDFFTAWGRLMIFGEFTPPPERKYAAGVAFLRGLGEGRVQQVHGLSRVLNELKDMVTDVKIPQPGQPKGLTYEGEGWVIVRHPDTQTVIDATSHIVSNVRVELVH